MEIALVGGSGRVGKRIAKYALERGHSVKTFNRHPDRVKVDGATAYGGDVADLVALTDFFQGADVIIYAVTVFRGDPPSYVIGIKNALKSAKEAGISRIIITNNYCTLKINGEEITSLFASPPPYNKVIPVYKEALNIIKEEKDLDWLVVTGPAFMPVYYDLTGKYIVQSGDEMIIPNTKIGPTSSKISMEDYASFILDQAERHNYSRERITVCNPYEIWES